MYKVLLIDDEALILESLEKTFPWEEVNCYVAATARNGEEGLRSFYEIQPHLVVTDIKMPDMNGLQFLKEILSDRSADEVIVLSGFDDFDFVRKALEYKVFHYLLKPIDRAELKGTLEKAIEEIEEKKKMQHTTLKTGLLEAIYQKNQPITFTKNLHEKSFAVLKIIHDKELKIADHKTETYEYFVYHLSNEVVLIIGMGNNIYAQLYLLAEDIIDKDENSRGALGPEVIGYELLPDSFAQVDVFLKQKEYIRTRIITESDFRDHQSLEKQSDMLLRKAKSFVEENYHQLLTIESIAKTFGFSSSYFSTKYKAVNGMTFSEHLKQTRVNSACFLLTSTNKPAYEIAHMVGYEDQRYFSQVFREVKKLSPSQYRKKYQS